jgi:flavin reductase (DIM6/NTAB) family NADH-FMN oxidoreductase RutF
MTDKTDTGAPPLIDAKRFWRTLGERAIGVTVVTATGKDGPAGFLALSAAHVSADPPTMLVSIDRRTSAIEAVLESRRFAVNILAREHEALSESFGGKSAEQHARRFVPEEWTTLRTGAPILRAALGVFDCELEQIIERPGVIVALGRVVDAIARGEGSPLIYFRGKYL